MDVNKSAAIHAFRLVFRPIARILLKAGINWRELAEVCKLTYVEVATQEFGIRGRPTNISRVAIMTGFTRREVRRLRNVLENEGLTKFESMNSATRILSGWYSDHDFTDELGEPLRLTIAGASPSFEALCSRYSGDVAPSTMLKELKHVGAIVEDNNGKLIAQSRIYMPVHMDPDQMLTSGSVMEDLGETVAYNLHRSTDEPPNTAILTAGIQAVSGSRSAALSRTHRQLAERTGRPERFRQRAPGPGHVLDTKLI